MNDIVFADRLPLYTGGEQKYIRCLKVAAYEGGKIELAPAGTAFTPSRTDGVIVCIDQPLLPSFPSSQFDDVEGGGIGSAAEQARLFFGKDVRVLSALGALIVGYAGSFLSRTVQPAVEKLKNDMDENLGDAAYSVEAYMRSMPLNYDYLRKLFKKEMGVTPHEYLTGRRMERARELILSGMTNRYSQFSVSQIAEACGFAEPLYFSRVFKQYYGASPLQFARDSGKRL